MLYSKQGVQNTPFQQVADAVGITQAALYKYFSGRDQLLRDAISHSAQRSYSYFFDGKPEGLNAKDELFHYINRSLTWANSEVPDNVAFMSVHYFASQIPIIKEVQKEITNARLKRFKMFLDKGNEEQLWSISDTTIKALTVHNYILGEMMAAFNSSENDSIEEHIARVCRDTLKLLS